MREKVSQKKIKIEEANVMTRGEEIYKTKATPKKRGK